MDHKIDERITLLVNNLYTYEDTDCLSSIDVENLSNNIHKDYVVASLYKTNKNIFLVLKRSFASVITKQLGLNNNLCTYAHRKISNLSANHIIDKNARNPKAKFWTGEIPVENHSMSGTYWMFKMHKNLIKSKFLVFSLKFLKALAQTHTNISW